MSSHLGWIPDEPRPLGGSMSTTTKHALAELFDTDTADIQDGGYTLDETHVAFLRGMKVGRNEGDDLYDDATELLAAIAEHKRIRLVRA